MQITNHIDGSVLGCVGKLLFILFAHVCLFLIGDYFQFGSVELYISAHHMGDIHRLAPDNGDYYLLFQGNDGAKRSGLLIAVGNSILQGFSYRIAHLSDNLASVLCYGQSVREP
jgi:hypothetical protein